MPPPRLRSQTSTGTRSSILDKIRDLYARYEDRLWIYLPLLLLIWEFFLCLLIVLKVPYTEIDWVAYMQEVAGFLENGETNYLNLKGDTGPLVYPGGFVYIFSGLYYLTEKGKNLRTAQWIFMGIYLMNLAVVLKIYQLIGRESLLLLEDHHHQTKKTKRLSTTPTTSCFLLPLWVLPLLTLSKRVHSIYVLRMFNDGVAMLLLHIAVLCFLLHQWPLGCVCYSLAVSVKMNIFLFAPGLLWLLCLATGLKGTILNLSICAFVQLVVAYPFLYTYPLAYLSKAFELSRSFDYLWTVNFRFLPKEIFVSKTLALLLLLGMLVTLLFFALKYWRALLRRKNFNSSSSFFARTALGKKEKETLCLSRGYIALTLFTSNFIGIAFARTLHYQFYSWYFHSLPLLLFYTPRQQQQQTENVRGRRLFSGGGKLLLLLAIEYAFNTYPSTSLSSSLLQMAHAIMLALLYLRPLPDPLVTSSPSSSSTTSSSSSRQKRKEN